MYMDHVRTLQWTREVRDVVEVKRGMDADDVAVFVLPSFPSLSQVVDALDGSGVSVGAQDLAWADSGAFTGEVSGTQLAQVGCALVEVGHAERRSLFAETDENVALKLAAAYRSGLIPVLCVGEALRGSPEDATRYVVDELLGALEESLTSGVAQPLIVAYEPRWAIGVAEPAPASYVAQVVTGIRTALENLPALAGSRIIYGGSAGVGVLSALDQVVDGVFLGRSAHDVMVVSQILDEVAALTVAGR